PIGPPEKRLGDSVELFAQPIGGLLADGTHPILELDRSRFAARVDLACGRALEVLDLSSLELGEGELDACARFAFGTVDLLRDGMLVLAEALVQLVDRATAVVRLDLEFVEGVRERVPRPRLELLTKPDCRDALLVDRRVELVRLRRDAGVDLGDA